LRNGEADSSVHSATLGKGKADDTMKKVKNGDLKGKGEVVMVFGKQVSLTTPVPLHN
jgi:hypothetical protein